jgi:UTP--glucose-1-phosphate uridylyltransferase
VPVRKAVIPAAGLGTRFLPATKALAKEMIPVVDKPGIQYAVEECVRAGIDQILVITARGKSIMEDHFDRSPDLEAQLEESGKTDLLKDVRAVADLAEVHYVRQKEPAGFGDAVLQGKVFCGPDPFAVLVPDEIVPAPIGDEVDLTAAMVEAFDRTGQSVVAVVEVPEEAIPAYGIVSPDPVSAGERPLVSLVDMVEKPSVEDAPSNLAARGRYVFTPELFGAIERTGEGVGGEIQLTDAIRILIKEQGAHAYVHTGPILDVGKKLDYLQATIELALRREDLADPLKAWLRARVKELDP